MNNELTSIDVASRAELGLKFMKMIKETSGLTAVDIIGVLEAVKASILRAELKEFDK